MNSWTNGYYHDSTGKILGSISLYNDKYKALIDNLFIGWFISEDHAKSAVESAYENAPTQQNIEKVLKKVYDCGVYAPSSI